MILTFILQRFMADIISVLALTMSEEGDRVSCFLFLVASSCNAFWFMFAK